MSIYYMIKFVFFFVVFHPKNNYSSRTPSSMFLQSEISKSVTSMQNTYSQKYSNQTLAKTSDHKTATTKGSSQVLPVMESSSHVTSTNKQVKVKEKVLSVNQHKNYKVKNLQLYEKHHIETHSWDYWVNFFPDSEILLNAVLLKDCRFCNTLGFMYVTLKNTFQLIPMFLKINMSRIYVLFQSKMSHIDKWSQWWLNIISVYKLSSVFHLYQLNPVDEMSPEGWMDGCVTSFSWKTFSCSRNILFWNRVKCYVEIYSMMPINLSSWLISLGFAWKQWFLLKEQVATIARGPLHKFVLCANCAHSWTSVVPIRRWNIKHWKCFIFQNMVVALSQAQCHFVLVSEECNYSSSSSSKLPIITYCSVISPLALKKELGKDMILYFQPVEAASWWGH